jgi:hypothetical protein
MTRVGTVLLDGGWSTTSEAEHALHAVAARLGLRPRTACTQFRTGPNRVVVSLELSGPLPAELIERPEFSESSTSGERGEPGGLGPGSGRAFIFPGSDTLTGVIPVADLLSGTAVEAVLLMGGGTADPQAELDTQDFVRPVFRDGRLVLLTRPGTGDRLLPFEQPNPTPCCADHR